MTATASPPSSSPSATRLRFWVVPHTHWDREWYATADDLRVRLVETIDEVLDTLEADERMAFTLDGQTAVVDDYLAVRPEQEPRLRALLATRRLVMGPFYVIGDEHLVGGESLLRNLLLGAGDCRRVGTEAMRLGYLPDTFGHVSQLPQLLRGFGIPAFVFTRGLGARSRKIGGVFRWIGVDGSELLAVQQPGGYSAAHRLGHLLDDQEQAPASDAERDALAAEQVRRLVERYAPFWEQVGMDDVLLSSGVDHGQIQTDLPAVLDGASEALGGAAFEIATYERFVEHVREVAASKDVTLPVVRDELPGGLDSDRLQDVDSARMPLKQLNELAERELLIAETVASLAVLADQPRAAGRPGAWRYPAGELRSAWRELLKNHAHDSIWGSSTDEVHVDMLQRFRTARHVARRVMRTAAAQLSGERDRYDYQPLTGELPRLPAPRAELSVLNPLPYTRRVTVSLRVPAALRDAPSLAVRSGATTTRAQLVRAPRVVTRPFAADAACPHHAANVDLVGTPDELTVLARLALPGFGTAPAALVAAEGDAPDHPATVVDERTLTNGLLTAAVAPDGRVTLTDHRTGIVRGGLLGFDCETDRGDEYTFCPLEGGPLWQSAPAAHCVVRVVEDGPVRASLEIAHEAALPAGLAADRASRVADLGPLRIVTCISLDAGAARLDCSTMVHNGVRDHRLRLLLPLGEAVHEVRCEGAYAVERRAAPAPDPEANGVREIHVNAGFVAAGEIALFTRGLPDHEPLAATDGEGSDVLALTLLRCVGWLSRPDLTTRPGGAGPTYPTPDAQCQGEHGFRYSISLAGSASDASLLRDSLDMRTGTLELGAGVQTSHLLRLDGSEPAFSTLKQAEDGGGVVLRLWNPGGDPAPARIELAPGLAARRCRPDESLLSHAAGTPDLLGPHEIATFRIGPPT